MPCTNCGSTLDEDARFCTECGRSVADSSSPSHSSPTASSVASSTAAVESAVRRESWQMSPDEHRQAAARQQARQGLRPSALVRARREQAASGLESAEAERAKSRTISSVLARENDEGCIALLARLGLILLGFALLLGKFLSLGDQGAHEYRFVIDAAGEVPWWTLALFAPFFGTLALQDEPAQREFLEVSLLTVARFCEWWSRVGTWLVLAGLSLGIVAVAIANATVLGVLIVIAILLAILVLDREMSQ